MPRPAVDTFVNLDDAGLKARFARWVGALSGWYEVTIIPRRCRRSDKQNKFFHACRVKPLADHLRDQDEALSPHAAGVIAKGMIKDQLLRTSVVDKATGRVVGSYVPSTRDLNTDEMSDLIDRSGVWLTKDFGLDVPAYAGDRTGLAAAVG